VAKAVLGKPDWGYKKNILRVRSADDSTGDVEKVTYTFNLTTMFRVRGLRNESSRLRITVADKSGKKQFGIIVKNF